MNYTLKNNQFVVNGQCYCYCKKERKKEKKKLSDISYFVAQIMSAAKNLSLSGPFFSHYVGIVSYVHIRLAALLKKVT